MVSNATPKNVLDGQSQNFFFNYRLSMCVRNFAALTIKKNYVNPKVTNPRRLYGVKIMTIERSKISYLGNFKGTQD
jgi:hypothetical protein